MKMEAKTSEWRPGPTVCRCCLTEGCYKDISTEYFWMGKREVYAEMLADTLNLTIAYSQSGGPNSNSRLICEPCISRLRDAVEFKRQVEECEKTFLQHLDPSTSGITQDASRESILKGKQVKVEVVKLERLESDDDFQQSRFSDDDDDDGIDDIDDQPLTKLAKTPKKESVDLLDLIDNAKVAEKRKSTTKVRATPVKKAKPKKETKTSKDKPEKKKKGVIHVTNSSMILKDEDGSDIKLAILKEPISIDNLIIENEEMDVPIDELENNIKSDTPEKDEQQISEQESSTLIFLKEPISISNIGNGTRISLRNRTLRTKTTTIRKKKNIDSDIRIQNALTLFEFSYIYPFIYAHNKFKCYTCSEEFLDSEILREHSLYNHSIKELKLELNKKFPDNSLKVDVKQLECKLCETTLDSLDNLKVHLKDHGKDIDPSFQDNIIPFKLGSDTHDCQICGDSYNLFRLLIIHMSKHFNNYSCEICGNVFVSKILLQRHLQVHKGGSFPCDKCNKVFATSEKRINHIKSVHLKQYVRTCPFCPERFNSYYARNKHLRIYHDQATRHKCDICERHFYLKYQMDLHKRSVHMQERNVECDICHFRFFSKSVLTRHMITHSGEKNFKCDICGQAYARKKNLLEHARSHLLAPTCSVCSLMFNDQPSLMEHMSSNHLV